MKLLNIFISITLIFHSLQLIAEENYSNKKVFESLIQPVFVAKCIECHGPNKSKGKLKLHTKEDFLKGGSGVGQDILIKGNIDDSELIYRITLPKDDDEAMPPMEDEEHYNPVTNEELSVMKAWISMGASFDLLVSDLDEKSKKYALHVFKNMPKKLLSKSLALQPKLPVVPPADPDSLVKIRQAGLLVMPIAQNTNALYVNASYSGKNFTDENINLLKPISKQLLWLNLARTGVTDQGIANLSGHLLLSRLHLENTSLTDEATHHLSMLPNIEYLNLYGTQITDASIQKLKKLKKLKKVFLWKTKVTAKGAETLRKSFVDSQSYDKILNQLKELQATITQLKKSEELKFIKLEKLAKEAGSKTTDKTPINKNCPVSNKGLDDTKFTIFEGRKIGFCCDKCKTKFESDGAVFRSKIKGFKASEEYISCYSDVQKAQLSMDKSIETKQQELRVVSRKLKGMGPEVNLGWQNQIVAK
jgi:hypothetical protein